MEPVRYFVVTDGTGKRPAGLVLGVVARTAWSGAGEGWIFTPWYQSQRSRRLWPTPEAALAGRVTGWKLQEHQPDMSNKIPVATAVGGE